MHELAGLDEESKANSNFGEIGKLFKNYSLYYRFITC